MQKFRDIVDQVLHPRVSVLVALVVITVLGELWCFGLGGYRTPLAYVIYIVSFYTLVAIVVSLIEPIRHFVEQFLLNHPRIMAFTKSEGLRAWFSEAWTFAYDVIYAIFVLVTGLSYDSAWAISVALYYFAVAALGLAISAGLWRSRTIQAADQRHAQELSLVRACGVLLLVMDAVLSGVMVQMVVRRQAWIYSEIVVISNATFTFIGLISAIRSAVMIRNVERASYKASRAVGLSKELVQLFFLETTMIAVFGSADNETFRFVMETITGSIIFLAIIAIAVALLVYVRRARCVCQGQDS